jgi:hypothetical protein
MANRRKPQPSNVLRGYGKEHKALRKAWQQKIDASGVLCARCGFPITPGMLWHLDHRDDRQATEGRRIAPATVGPVP